MTKSVLKSKKKTTKSTTILGAGEFGGVGIRNQISLSINSSAILSNLSLIAISSSAVI